MKVSRFAIRQFRSFRRIPRGLCRLGGSRFVSNIRVVFVCDVCGAIFHFVSSRTVFCAREFYCFIVRDVRSHEYNDFVCFFHCILIESFRMVVFIIFFLCSNVGNLVRSIFISLFIL